MTIMSLSNIHKSYSAQQPVLRGLSLTVAAGELVALCGPSGSGKTSLLNIAGLLDAADAGDITFNSQTLPVHRHHQATLRRKHIGFVFQQFNLIPVMTAWQNIEYPLNLLGISHADKQKSIALILEKVGMAGYGGKYPASLSGGQKQRIAIARALIKRPSLIIADEPSASLDSDNTGQIAQLLKELTHETGTGCLIATHDDHLSRYCDRIIHIQDGLLMDEQTTEVL